MTCPATATYSRDHDGGRLRTSETVVCVLDEGHEGRHHGWLHDPGGRPDELVSWTGKA